MSQEHIISLTDYQDGNLNQVTKKEPENDFEDWIDNINRFIHFLNPHPSISSYTTLSPPIALYVTSNPATIIDTPKIN
jgi:poly-beta-hydroxyalkanoate depolymerase